MRKKIILAVILIVAIVAIIGGYHYLNNNETESSLTPWDLIVNLSENKENAMFDKTKNYGHVNKFIFKDFDDGCVYSLNQTIFLVAENSDEEKVMCYLDCATKENCTPIAITVTGNYMIFETQQGEKIAVPMERSEMERLIETKEEIAFDDLAQKEKDSLLKLVEE